MSDPKARDEARKAYQAAYLKHAQLEERYDAIEQMPDRETELRWDNRLLASEQKVQEAVDRLHALGGRTIEEARATRPSERFVVRSMGDMFGLGESWEVYDEEFDRQVTAVGSEQKANDYLAAADAKWEQKQREQQERAARRQEGSV